VKVVKKKCLLRNENLFHTIFEAVNLPITLINNRYEYEWVNACYCRAQGTKPSDLIGNTVSAVWGQEVFDGFIKENIDRCLEGYEVRKEAWVNFSTRGRCYCETVYSPYMNHEGEITSVIVVTYDITDRKVAEEQIENSEHRFRSLAEASLEAIVFIEDGIIVDANDALNRLFGYEGEDLRGKRATDFIAPERRAYTDKRIKARAEEPYETFGLRKDGSTFPIEVNPRELEHDGKKVRVSAVRDLTGHKKIEKQLIDYQEHLELLVDERTKELKKSEEKFRNIFEDAVVGIYQSTPEGRFLMVNPALAHMYGYKRPEELVLSIKNLATDIYVDPERRKDFIALAEREGIVRNFGMQARTQNGSIKYVSVNAHTVKDGNGKVLYYEGMVQDVTERRLALALVTLQRDLALKLARVQSLGEGLAVILQAAITASGMECGGISLKNSETGGFDLVHSAGLTKNFQKKIQHILVGSFTWSQMMEKKSFHVRPNKKSTPIAFQEGFRFISVMPILQEDDAIGFLVVASKVLTEVPEQVRMGLEVLAAESGNIIARIQAREQLEREALARREAQESLECEHSRLEETNIALMEANSALKVLLKHREEDRKELEEKILANVQQLVLPHVEKLKKSAHDPVQQMSIDLVESNLKEITSSFLKGIQNFRFTPRQLEVSILVREGKTTKDIAGLLHVSRYAVDLLRFQIRKKLGLNKEKTNLQSYLKSLR
jgi:PAS domain S-box-containing protein